MQCTVHLSDIKVYFCDSHARGTATAAPPLIRVIDDFAVIAHGIPSISLEINRRANRAHAAIAKNELNDAGVIAAEAAGIERVGQLAGRDVLGILGRGIVRSGQSARIERPYAVVNRAVTDLIAP